MAGGPDPTQERERRLQQVRDEIKAGFRQGVTPSADDWASRYPDLRPEVAIMVRELLKSGAQQATFGPNVAGPGMEETAARSASPSQSVETDITASTNPTEPGNPARADLPPAGETVRAPSGKIGSGQDEVTAAENGAGATAHHAGGANGPTARRRVRYIGDYETISILGQGGMGVVYKARQLSLNRLVALKMIRNAEFAGEDQVRRFQNEAEAVATLDHPGIVPIYEVGTHEDERYFSMKMIDGQSLDKKLDALAKDPRAAARVVAAVADAVHHAHQRGILHRDLKPANILLDSQGQAHVTDFGLAKRIDEDAGITVSGAIMGTPSYMAPEQAAGRSALVTTARLGKPSGHSRNASRSPKSGSRSRTTAIRLGRTLRTPTSSWLSAAKSCGAT